MAGVLSWVFAVLSNQLQFTESHWLSFPLDIVLFGPGRRRLAGSPCGEVRAGRVGGSAAAIIEGRADEFPEWATGRAPWRDRGVRIRDDEDHAVRFWTA